MPKRMAIIHKIKNERRYSKWPLISVRKAPCSRKHDERFSIGDKPWLKFPVLWGCDISGVLYKNSDDFLSLFNAF